MPFYQNSSKGSGRTGFLNTEAKVSSGGGFLAARGTGNGDLDSVDGLLKLAREKGLLAEAGEAVEEDKLSMLQRLSFGLGAFNPAEAIARDLDGTENFMIAYPKTVVQGIF